MRLHVFNARRVSDDLAAGSVTPQEQAAYVAMGFVAWILVNYSDIPADAASRGTWFAFALYWLELGMLVLMNIFGVFYCLRQCRVAPERHFIIDFTCLYAPVSVVTLVATWAAFHALAWGLPRAFATVDDYRTADYLTLRLYDVLRWLTVVGQVFVIFLAVGRYMRRTSDLRA